MYTTRHHLQSLSMSRFEDVTLLSHSPSPSTPTIETWRLTRFSPQGSVQLLQQSDPADKIFLVEPPFEWPPSDDRNVDAIKVLLGVLPDCEGGFLVDKVLRNMFCVKTGEEARKREVGRVTEWVEGMWKLSVTERKTVLDVVYRVLDCQLANENRAIRKEITVQNGRDSSSEADKSPAAPKSDREKKIAKDSPSDTSDLPPYTSIFTIPVDPGNAHIETIWFRDGCDLSSSNTFRIFPGSKTTTRRVRAARALLCTPHIIRDATTNTPLPNPPTQKLVELLLGNLSSSEVMQHASTSYAVRVEEMAWLRETGIRKLGGHMGVDVEPLFPDIMSEFLKDRKRAGMSLREDGDESPRVKRRRVEEDEDEEVSEESSEEEEDDDEDDDESYTEESSRRRRHRRKVSVETTSSEPTRRDTPVKRPSPTTSRVQPPFKPTKSLPTSQILRTPDDITTNMDDSLTRIFRLCREHKTQLLKCNILRAKRDALQTQKEDTTGIKEDIRKAVSKRKSLKKQAKREKMKCQREFLVRQNLGFRKVFEQFEIDFFGLECGMGSNDS